MHKFYGFLIASAFAVGLAVPHGARAAGPFGQYDPSGTKGGGRCIDPKMPCEATPGSGEGANPVIPAPSIPGSNCTQCEFRESHKGECVRVAIGDWGCEYPEPEKICIGKRGKLGLTCRDDGLLGGSPGFGWGF